MVLYLNVLFYDYSFVGQMFLLIISEYNLKIITHKKNSPDDLRSDNEWNSIIISLFILKITCARGLHVFNLHLNA